MPEKSKFGFKDLRTAAELALSPARPAARTVPSIGNLRFDGKLGSVASAAALSAAAFSSIRSALSSKQNLQTLQTSITNSLGEFDAEKNALISGRDVVRDVSVFGMNSSATVKDGGFFSASDLVQMSSAAPGVVASGISGVSAILALRRSKLSNLTSRISISLNNFSIGNSGVIENYNRIPYPLPDELDLPSIPRLAQGGDAAAADSALRDKRRFTVKGAVTAFAKPSTWSRLTSSYTDPLKGFRLQSGFNPRLNMVFADKKQQKTWSEPSTPYAAQFPNNIVKQTESGHLEEWDDTPGAERIHFFHRSGSFIEMHPNGDVVFKSMNNGYTITMANQYVRVRGTCNISVDGDANIYAKGDMNLQGEKNINFNAGGEFNVFAKKVNIRAKKTVKVDGTKIDLRYATLPGVPVMTMSGPAVRLNPAPLKQDFPELHREMDAREKQWKNALNRVEQSITKTPGHHRTAFISTNAVVAIGPFGVPYPVVNLTPIVQQLSEADKATLTMVRLLRDGVFPKADTRDVRNNRVVLGKKAPKEFAFPELSELGIEEPVESPLANPLPYLASTPASVNYRALLLDTPEEMGDTEQYQAHQEMRQLIGDIGQVGPQLPGKRTQPESGITAPETLPLVKYLNRDAYRGKFSSDPGQTLGGTAFTYGELSDALARPDVANPDVPATA